MKHWIPRLVLLLLLVFGGDHIVRLRFDVLPGFTPILIAAGAAVIVVLVFRRRG